MTKKDATTNRKIRVILIDDHPLYREGLKLIMEKDPKYEVVGEAGSGREGLQLVGTRKPDMALVDMSLPDQSGPELIRDLLNISGKLYILVVSMHCKVDFIVQAFQVGARGYIVKEAAADMLLQGMDQVLKGHYFMDATASGEVIKKLMGMPARESNLSDAGYETLTSREQEVMMLLAQGLTTKQIADRLFISPKTAENHRYHIMTKLGVHSTFDLMRYAARIGIIDTDLWKG